MLLPDSASPDPNKNYKIQNDCNLPKDIFPENYVNVNCEVQDCKSTLLKTNDFIVSVDFI